MLCSRCPIWIRELVGALAKRAWQLGVKAKRADSWKAVSKQPTVRGRSCDRSQVQEQAMSWPGREAANPGRALRADLDRKPGSAYCSITRYWTSLGLCSFSGGMDVTLAIPLAGFCGGPAMQRVLPTGFPFLRGESRAESMPKKHWEARNRIQELKEQRKEVLLLGCEPCNLDSAAEPSLPAEPGVGSCR